MARERDYAREYEHQGTPEQIARRSSRNKARRLLIKMRGKAALRGKQVDHKDFNAMNNNPSNLRAVSARQNQTRQPSRS